jgi:hypothetical protein
MVNNVRNNTGPPGGIGAAAPNAAELASVTGAPLTARPGGWDTDNDGMPNSWELARGLNPNSAADNTLDFDSDGYVNVVEYLNEAGDFPAPVPIIFTGATNNRYAQFSNWKSSDGAGSNWQPGSLDVAIIDNATVVIDSVGQNAGSLILADQPMSTTMLNVNAGWIDTIELVVGAEGTGVVNQTGGEVRSGYVQLGAFGTGQGAYNLSGGRLLTGSLAEGRGVGASFQFTGGILSAEGIGFDLVNQGGIIAPGDRIGGTYVDGNVTLSSSSTLEIEIGGKMPGQYDQFVVDGFTELGGTLRVTLPDQGNGSYMPQLGDDFIFFQGPRAFGDAFDHYELPPLAPGLDWAVHFAEDVAHLLVITAAGTADFNYDHRVDDLDLGTWISAFGTSHHTDNRSGDATGDGRVDGVDFLAWQRQFGAAPLPASGIPEPHAALLAMLAAFGLRFVCHGHGRGLARPCSR